MTAPPHDARTRPVWLLDIDGVVNALARGAVRGSWPQDAWIQRVIRADMPGHGPMVLPILAARPVLDFVAQVYHSGTADVRWHSTWRAAAMTELAPVLGLPPIPISVAPEWTAPPYEGWWKLPAARRVLESGRRLVWTDDDLGVFAAEVGDLVSRPDALLIGPDRHIGLTGADLDSIAAFLQL
jgi:hypothetical protein